MRRRITDRTFLSLAAAAAMLFAADAYLIRRIHKLGLETARLEWSVVTGLADIRSVVVTANEAHHDGIEALAAELEATQCQAATDADRTKAEAQEYARRMAQRVAGTRRRHLAWANRELTHIRAAALAADKDAEQLQTQLQETREVALAARADSNRAAPDLLKLSAGVDALAPRAAADRDEYSAMRTAAEREALKFHLTKSGQPMEIAGVTLALRKADPKTNRYSIAIVSRKNQRIEAKNRTLQEPVRLYTSSERQNPLELVVDEIGQDEVAGFVWIPPTARVARDYSSGGNGTDSFPLP